MEKVAKQVLGKIVPESHGSITTQSSALKGCVCFILSCKGNEYPVDIPYWVFEKAYHGFANQFKGYCFEYEDKNESSIVVENVADKSKSLMYIRKNRDQGFEFSDSIMLSHKKLNKLVCEILRYHYNNEIELFKQLVALEG